MRDSLYTLVKRSKTDVQSMNRVIEMFSPKILSSLNQTNHQDREDLSQEIKMKLLLCIKNFDVENTPGYFQVMEQLKERDVTQR
ncbi:helix-turn-helix protein [Cytobacillus firmus]|uniref:Helix-turn-helix protein n=2 Tax=Cytobacillus TaxID=2675230 RepID=A0A366JJ11_CYTFI|nr:MULTISPECIES: helix-turn-helix domain-containing protein [Cytobacillus]RBP86542.1 helix-turn-helix protein [Cytobacillus firmus]TDX39283.1 helix-turn-helix protein [Cytobacillus oceanisediminis]